MRKEKLFKKIRFQQIDFFTKLFFLFRVLRSQYILSISSVNLTTYAIENENLSSLTRNSRVCCAANTIVFDSSIFFRLFSESRSSQSILMSSDESVSDSILFNNGYESNLRLKQYRKEKKRK